MRFRRATRGGTSTEYVILLVILMMTGFLAYQYLGKSTNRSTHAAGASLNGESPAGTGGSSGGGGAAGDKGKGGSGGSTASKKSGGEQGGDDSRAGGSAGGGGGGSASKKGATATNSPDNAAPSERSRGKSHSITQGWFFKIFVAGMIFAGVLAVIFGARKKGGAAAK